MTVFMEAVASATADLRRVQPLGGVTDKRYPYAVYSASLGSGDGYSLTARNGLRHGLVSVQTFGETTDGALTLMEAIANRLLDEVLAVDGWDLSPMTAQFRSPRVNRDPDDQGVVGATQAFSFVAVTASEES